MSIRTPALTGGVIVVMTLILIPYVTLINASADIKWKTFNDKNGIFTIKHPSNWSPLKLDEEGDSSSLINAGFYYQGKGSSFATINLLAEESIFTNITDRIESASAFKQNHQKYRIIEPIACGKYTINVISACSQIDSYILEIDEYPKKPLVNQLTIGAIGDDGTEYLFLYTATQKQFDDILPIAEDIIKSFSITGTAALDDESSTELEESPELPPLSPSSNGL